MRVGIYLRPEQCDKLRRCLESTATTIEATPPDRLARRIEAGEFDTVFIDPEMCESRHLGALRAALGANRAVTLVIYTAVTPAAMQGLMQLGHLATRLLLRRYDDTPSTLQRALTEAGGMVLARRCLDGLRDRLAGLPDPIWQMVERAYADPRSFRGVADLAHACQRDERSIERWLKRSGLGAPRDILASARLTRAYYYIRCTGLSLAVTAQAAGLRSERVLRRQFRVHMGLPIAEVRTAPETSIVTLAVRIASGRRSHDVAGTSPRAHHRTRHVRAAIGTAGF